MGLVFVNKQNVSIRLTMDKRQQLNNCSMRKQTKLTKIYDNFENKQAKNVEQLEKTNYDKLINNDKMKKIQTCLSLTIKRISCWFLVLNIL